MSLLDLLNNDTHAIEDTTAIKMSLNISSGLNYIHSEHIIHCDLAARNILVSKYPYFEFGRYLSAKER